MTELFSIYGVGLGYPMRLNASGSRPHISSGEGLIEESITAIVNTDVYERPFLVKEGVPYGTRFRRALFEPSEFAIDVWRYEVPKALSVWEPRIYVVSADATEVVDDEHRIIGTVRYRNRSTNREDNYVRPYRLRKPDNQA